MIGRERLGAGLIAASLLSIRRVLVLEREKFPRYHIGESMIPFTYQPLQRLGLIDRMRASAFVKKYSVQFVGSSGRLSAPFYFWDNKPHECSQTWQVVRSEFDQMMLDNARELGATAHEGVRVVQPARILSQDHHQGEWQVLVEHDGANGSGLNGSPPCRSRGC